MTTSSLELPLIPVRDVVIFPHASVPISLKREKSVVALEEALLDQKRVFLVMQKNKDIDNPDKEDLFQIGTVAKITQIQRLPDGVINITVEGEYKAAISKYLEEERYFKVTIKKIGEEDLDKADIDKLLKPLTEQFRQSISLGKPVPLDSLPALFDLSNPYQTLDLIIYNLDIKPAERQKLLEVSTQKERIKLIESYLSKDLSVLKTARKIQDRTAEEIGKNAKEAFLREQLRTIEKELGLKEEREEFADLEKKIKASGMSEEVEVKALKELDRLRKMPQFSPEVSFVRTYLDWLVDLPWKERSEGKVDIKKAENILNKDHYGLKKIKERIIEYLAVQKLTGKIKGPILCFAGPPGVGKTSIGRSIAKALNRKFVKVSLGGIRDEAEIRGHRRTYVGALPGRIIQGVKDAGTIDPIFMLDEIDKLGYDFRGDPSAALLEALDPEQNHAFSDHYLEVPYDLSNVMFVTTANILDTIPPALRDRMEILEFPGYTDEEKFHIARDFLLPKQTETHGLKEKNLKISDQALAKIISSYTREAGVRSMERELASICRKVAKQIAEGKTQTMSVTDKNLQAFLGPEKFIPWTTEKKDEVGVASGLAWTEVGGEVLSVETTLMPGRGNLLLTGHLGDVMKESAQAGLSYVKSRLVEFGLRDNIYKNIDIHLHVPAGAIPKDGPSAGITMATSLLSALAKIPVRKDVGMTGEITLRGKVLEIGGIKEKVLAAHRSGLRTIILPTRNKKDLEEIPAKTRAELKFIYVDNMEDVLKNALVTNPFKVSPNQSRSATPAVLPSA
ncbi:MAG: endopeptidase La [Candidatus Woykebacteria bacterium RIFCSPHIGHO2_12_FULL_45_10]|uniref:Lon protease n=1 Tax=Candidatus Woykebacteria bacterium RIFCSPHIGHO2_12_FULL_45_10 TaxID=1802603 RepID=A0A1G1WPL2_9BACT|nr:MAG: endopeptidase La [Candidatus Woykebacteria bacterium RIFCSPHIGHO2_12_FULL_45_10]